MTTPSGLLQASAYLAELVINLELLTNFMLSSSEVKVVVSETGLANLLHRLWFYCESDSQLMVAAISALVSYTQQSNLGKAFIYTFVILFYY